MDFKDSLRDIKSQMLAENGAKNLGGNGETAAHSISNSNDAEKAYYANLERKKEALQSEVKEFLGL